jgi:hypothetical protein
MSEMNMAPERAEYLSTFPGAIEEVSQNIKNCIFQVKILTNSSNREQHHRNNGFGKIGVIGIVGTQNETTNQSEADEHGENQHQILDIFAHSHIQNCDRKFLRDFMV